MFGFLIGSEVNDDSVKLKTFCDSVIKKYLPLEKEQLIERIRYDFSDKQHHITIHECNFVFEEMPEFMFCIDLDGPLAGHLSVHGRGKYHGFMLQVSSEDKIWTCSATDGIASAATGGARKLVKVMCKKYDASDFGKVMRRCGVPGY